MSSIHTRRHTSTHNKPSSEPGRVRTSGLQARLIVAVAVAIAAPLMLSACNTTEGAGKDIKSLGKGIEETAKDAKN